MRDRGRASRGFALVFAIVISVVMTGLVTAVVLRVLTDQKVGKNLARQLSSREDADLALRFAETEILSGMDKMLMAYWTVNGTFSPTVEAGHYSAATTRTTSELDINALYPAQTADAMLRHKPLLQLTLLANPRNWPAFCDWRLFDGNWNSSAASFAAMTRYWRLVPRDTKIDDDWYTGAGVTSFPIIIAQRKDAQTGALFPGDGYLTTVSAGGDPRNGHKAVKHSFWYEQLLPLTAGAAATGLPATPGPSVPGPSPTPLEAKYIPAESTYRPTGEQWPNRTAEYPAPMNLLDTPFYKKLYEMPSGGRVAVYCRLDLREYLAGTAATLGVDQRRSDRLLRFYLAAVTEGRIDGKGDKQTFKPSEITGKYIYVSSGGMELKALNVSRESVETELGANTVPPDFNWFPGVLDNVGRSLSAGATMSGQVFRADGNLGYRLVTYGRYQWGADSVPVTPAPGDLQQYFYPDGTVNKFNAPPMQTFFYLWEDARPDKTNTTTAYVEANTNFIWMSYDRANPAATDSWTWHRTPFVNPLLEPPLIRTPAAGKTPSPNEPLVDSPNSIVSSTSGFIDRTGYFEVWPKGTAADGANEWKGPREGNEYYLSSDDSFTRTGAHLMATASFR